MPGHSRSKNGVLSHAYVPGIHVFFAAIKTWMAISGVCVQAPGQEALLGMQPILGFIEDNRLRTVDDLIGHLLAAVCGQAMHEQRIRSGLGHQAGIDLVPLEDVVPKLAVAIAHRHPCIGNHAVRILDRGIRIIADQDGGA